MPRTNQLSGRFHFVGQILEPLFKRFHLGCLPCLQRFALMTMALFERLALGAGAAAAAGAGAPLASAAAGAGAGAPPPSLRKRDGASSAMVSSGCSARARSSSTASVSGLLGSGTQQSTGHTAAHASWS